MNKKILHCRVKNKMNEISSKLLGKHVTNIEKKKKKRLWWMVFKTKRYLICSYLTKFILLMY